MKILVPGSGPIIIGQAAEFDYSGTQCCQALREAGHTVILVNSNPALSVILKSCGTIFLQYLSSPGFPPTLSSIPINSAILILLLRKRDPMRLCRAWVVKPA